MSAHGASDQPAGARTVEVDAARLASSDHLDALSDGRLAAVLVRGVYASHELAPVVERLRSEALRRSLAHRDHADASRVQIRVLGVPVSPSDVHPRGPDVDVYFREAEPFRALCAELFEPADAFDERVGDVLVRLSGGRASARAEHPRLGRYGAATIRCMPPGCGLPPHCENDYMDLPVLQALQPQVELERQLGLLMPLVVPRAGGEVVVYAQSWPEARGSGDAAEMASIPHAVLAPEVGDLLLLRSGPQFHAVRTVEGDIERWTIGGFCARRRDGGGYLHWA